MRRKLYELMSLLAIIRIPNNYGNVCDGRLGRPVIKEF